METRTPHGMKPNFVPGLNIKVCQQAPKIKDALTNKCCVGDRTIHSDPMKMIGAVDRLGVARATDPQ